MRRFTIGILAALTLSAGLVAQSDPAVDWSRVQTETLQHYQALLRLDTSDPPGNESVAASYLRQVLEREGIPVQLFEAEPNRANLVARLKGNGKKRPMLMMAHTDVVRVDPKKWTFPPFSATRDGGYIYGRGTIDDKDNLVASLMTMLLLKRTSIPLDRDVIFLAEAGEEAATRVGIELMVRQHFPEIDAEYCLAEAGSTTRVGGRVQFAQIQAAEKVPHPVELTVVSTSGHASVPRLDNPVVHLAAAVAALGAWKPPIRITETTREYFTRLTTFALPQDAARYRAVLTPETKAASDAVDYFAEHDPTKAAMLRSSLSPTLLSGGVQVNVIPSEAKATIDVRLLPVEDPAAFLEAMRKVVNDPLVKVEYTGQNLRPDGKPARLDTEVFKAIESAIASNYDTTTIPTMGNGATDMAFLRAKGVECYGIGSATDLEDVAKGFGAHSDQERLLESELHRFVRFNWDLVLDLVRAK
jgi:acetylornithine deacetylase/succinyl-diaminopimelate desuccinylase-like protein